MAITRKARKSMKKFNPLNYEIKFTTQPSLYIEMKTVRLIIRSITDREEKIYIQLLGDPKVMKKYAEGNPYEEEKARELLKTWVDRWDSNNPYSGYAIFRMDSYDFVGTISIRNSAPDECRVAYILRQKYWGQGYGTEAAHAIVDMLIPRLMLRNYQPSYRSLKKIMATALPDNPASEKILIGSGFEKIGKAYEYGAVRNIFCLFARTKKNNYHHFFHRMDCKLNNKEHASIKNKGVDITDEKMANSEFGQRRNHMW